MTNQLTAPPSKRVIVLLCLLAALAATLDDNGKGLLWWVANAVGAWKYA